MLSNFPVAIGIFLLTLTLGFKGYAQSESEVFTAKNTVFVEVGGNAGTYAINYGRIFSQKGLLKLSGSAGFMMWRHNTSNQPYNRTRTMYWLPSLPLEVSAFVGRSKHHVEIGTGITPFLSVTVRQGSDIFTSSDKVYLGAYIPLRLGYRYQKPDGGFFYRVAYTPFFRFPANSEGNTDFSPIFAGISLGKSF